MSGSSSSSSTSDQSIIEAETRKLRLHLGLGERPGMPVSSTPPAIQPRFFIELTPPSPRNGAACKLPTCSDWINSGDYRLVLSPGMSSTHWTQYYGKKADFYHVACFENIADLSDADFLDRIFPVTRATYRSRNLQEKNILNGFLCDGAVERLVPEWKVQRGKWIDEQKGQEQELLDPALNDLLRKAGSSSYIPVGLQRFQHIPGMDIHEYHLLCDDLAPFESDGQDDEEEWNLFETYLNDDKASLEDKHDLSKMLSYWKTDQILAKTSEDSLTEAEKRAKAKLGKKATRAIKRLSQIAVPL